MSFLTYFSPTQWICMVGIICFSCVLIFGDRGKSTKDDSTDQGQ